MTNEKKLKPIEHKQIEVVPPPFDAYDKDASRQEALGSGRTNSQKEVGNIQSVNFRQGVSGWRLTPLGLELGNSSGVFPPGTITFADIQDIATARLLGRSTAGTGSIEQILIGTGLSLAAGSLSTTITQYTDELAQDAVGGILTDTNSIDFTYNDGANTITADLKKQDSTTVALTIDASGLKAAIVAAYQRKSLFDHFSDVGNIGTGEDDLYSDTIAAAQLANNGEKLEAEYGGVFVSSATATRQIRIYFGGTAIFDSGALTLSLSAAWDIYVTIIRVSASVIRYMVTMTTEGAALAAYTAVGEVTGLTLANTNVLKITGEAAGVGAATNDIVAKLASVEWKAAA